MPPIHTGRLGEQLSTAEGTVAAEAVMLNLLAPAKAEVGELSANLLALLAGLGGQAAVSVCASMGGEEVTRRS